MCVHIRREAEAYTGKNISWIIPPLELGKALFSVSSHHPALTLGMIVISNIHATT